MLWVTVREEGVFYIQERESLDITIVKMVGCCGREMGVCGMCILERDSRLIQTQRP